jgi:hypothetical protein
MHAQNNSGTEGNMKQSQRRPRGISERMGGSGYEDLGARG